MSYYLFQLPITHYKREQLLRLCFALIDVSINEIKHRNKFEAEDILDDYNEDFYKKYLRNEDRSYLKK